MEAGTELKKGEPVESYGAGVEQPGQEVDPKMKGQVDNYVSVLMNLLHNEKTSDDVMGMLGTNGDIFEGVPNAAVAINDMGVNLMSQGGEEISFAVQLGASVFLMGDLIELGYAAGLWEQPTEEEIAAVYEDTLQVVIERGLADGSIDPIQLQVDAEGMMSEDQKRAGDGFAQAKGMGGEPSQQAMTQQYADRQVNKQKQKQAKTGTQQTALAGRQGAGRVA